MKTQGQDDRTLSRKQQPVRWYRFEVLVWLAPLAYLCHIAEEAISGFPLWTQQVIGGQLTGSEFIFNNSVVMAVLLLLTFWASRSQSRVSAFMVVSWLSGNLFWNFLFHLIMTAATNTYSPGVMTAALLYYPVSVVVTVSAVKASRLSLSNIFFCYLVAFALHSFVLWSGIWHFDT